MTKPKFTWFVLEDEDFIATKNYITDGAFGPGDILRKKIQIYNNYMGKEDINDAKNARLVLAFKHYQDNFLLNNITVRVGNGEAQKLTIEEDRGYVNIGTIFGHSNSAYIGGDNYKQIEITIGPIPSNIQSELKSLIFYLEYDI